MRDGLHRGAPSRLAQPQACGTMAVNPRKLRLPGVRRSPGSANRYRACDEGAGTDVAAEARDGKPPPRSDRSRSRLGQDPRVSGGRESGTMARSLAEPPAKAFGSG